LIAWQLRMSKIGAAQRTLQFASLAFDVSFQEIFATWCAGGGLVLVEERTRRDAGALVDFLDEQRIARLFLPYVALQGLTVAAAASNAAPQSLHEVIVAGEALRITAQIADLFARLRYCRLVNQYGPSETHVVTAFEVTGDPQNWPALPPIGRPIDNVRVLILDEDRRPVPPGIAGEIHIGGAALARGYLNSPELTAEKFVAGPLSDGRDGTRLYRTGDLGRLLPDGNLEFLGRRDRQVKLHGYRIEPGEIEVILAGHPQVDQVVVKPYEPTPDDKRLTAYIVPRTGAPPAVADLKRFARDKLPPYMVPSSFVFVARIPVTPSGKIDLAALPAPEACDRPAAATDLPPRNELERRLATIWAQVLRVKSVGATDNFFDCGGDSLLALRLAAEIETNFARTVPLGIIFSAPTIGELAATLDRDDMPATGFSLVPLQTAGIKPPLFVVHWIHRDLVRQLGTGRPIYGLSYGLAAQTVHQSVVLPAPLEQVALQYLAEMQSMQPHGPYFLMGYSGGGVIAYEIARQLAARGESVAFLGLLDTSAPGEPSLGRYPLHRQISNLLRLSLREHGIVFSFYFSLHRSRILRWLHGGASRLMDLENLLLEGRNSAQLWTQYSPKPYPGRLTFFKPNGVASIRYRLPAPELAWGTLAEGGVEICEVPGRHQSMMLGRNARVLATELLACLDGGAAGDRAAVAQTPPARDPQADRLRQRRA
jgi:thioesterase domain-containing protein